MPPPIGQQGPSFTITRILAIMGLVAAATTGYFFAVPGGSTGGMLFKESTAAGTPAAGERVVYAKSGGMYQKDSAGTESNLGGGTQNGTTGGTANSLVKATSANTLADSTITEASGQVTLTGGVYPATQLNLGGATSGFAGITTLSGGLQLGVVSGDGLGNYKGLTALNLTANGGDVGASQDLVSGRYIYISTGGHYGLMTNPVEGVLSAKEGNGTTAGWFQNTAGRSYATADQVVDSDTLTADDTVTVTLKAGRKYSFSFTYFFTPGDTVADGFQINLDGGNATATGIIGNAYITDNTGVLSAVTNSRLTALNTTTSIVTQPTTSFTVRITGFIEVNAAGTFLPKFAKNADVGTGVTKKKYSAVLVEDFP